MTDKKTPNAEEFREFLREHKLTGAEAGELAGIGSRQIRRYTGDAVPLPYSVWYTLHHAVTGKAPPGRSGFVSPARVTPNPRRFVLHPGEVITNQGERRFIDARSLASLYGIDFRNCTNSEDERYKERHGDVHLIPRPSGIHDLDVCYVTPRPDDTKS